MSSFPVALFRDFCLFDVLFALLLAVAADTVPSAADTATYSTPALATLIAEAVELNRRVPSELGGYRARLESEISIGARRSERVEMSVQLEQVASTLTWDRTGRYEQVVQGYRTQALGTSFATIGFFEQGWAIPSLYGNRITLLFGVDTSEAARRRRERRGGRPIHAVHPLAEDRDGYYRFSGGDTVMTLNVEDRTIQVVRVQVEVKPAVPELSVVFVGQMDLDVTRRHIVRLRGYFARVGGEPSRWVKFRNSRLQAIAYVEAVNAEVDGKFWLPSYQRFEAQALTNTVGESRAIFRMVTHYRDRELLPAPVGVLVGSVGDTLVAQPFRLAVHNNDSLSGYRDWRREIGEATTAVSAEDFDDVAPQAWRDDGPPRLDWGTERFSDILRTDRIQGVFTGLGVAVRLRDAMPGVTARATAGYAWSEQTFRGRVEIEKRTTRTAVLLRASRSLDITNDFRNPYDSGTVTGPLFGSDPYDYVDRWMAGVHVRRFVGEKQWAAIRIESGIGEDRDVQQQWTQSPIGWGRNFRANRPVTPGHYARNALAIDWRPDVSVEFLRSGMGARVQYERADGQLTYQRVEARLTARAYSAPLVFGARLDVGSVSPTAPPQQFFELGRNQNLPGYGYKAFAGDQAAVLRGGVSYLTPFWQAPVRLTARYWLPPPAPTLAIGAQGGWSRATTTAADNTVTALGSTTTGHVRSSGSITLRFFGQSLGIGVARPLDYPGKWRWVFEAGQRL